MGLAGGRAGVKVFALWDKGRDGAPDLVRRCLDRWEALNPGHELVVLDRAAMEAELAGFPDPVRDLPIQAASDVLRVHLLARHGGVWVDATVLPTMPLDDWLPELLAPAGFFAFLKPGAERPLSSWFLAAEPGASIPPRLDAEIRAYWSRPRARRQRLPPTAAARLKLRLRAPALYRWAAEFERDRVSTVRPEQGRDSGFHPYYWLHYLVAWLIESDPDFRAAWSRMPARAAIAVHNLQRARTDDGLTPDEFRQAVPQLLRTGPVQKLNWRMDWPEETFAPVDPARVAI
ncbi:capsular polysaccharide synthesis protein [Roseitranquillus sediminis]|uniref:capsular polysaccharide synthesis protein n=1 Tax=Roseitranquillus sediminis TaxID=2809051 RepID=UPI001D0CC31D|nr:capsular polysaccharide synthesis protein [Roseitranquillus sediminis]MBM9595170.1 hypothetical protein [Roseitranquillus sediminis]